MVSKYKKSGWFNESQRHSLARKGIRTGRKDCSLPKPIDYGRQLSSKEFRIDDNNTIVCRSEKTSYGFRHLCDLYSGGALTESEKATYYNRTWESFEFETAIRKLLDKIGMSKEKKESIINKISGKSRSETEGMFKSIGMVASLGEVFAKTEKEKNAWKLRMIKVGLGDKGFQEPENWDTLSEKEKGERLDKVIETLKGKKINYSIESYKGQGVFDPFYESDVDSDNDGIPDLYDLHPVNPYKGVEWSKKKKINYQQSPVVVWDWAKPEVKGQQLRIRVQSPSKFEKFRTQDVGRKGYLQRLAGYSPKKGWQTQSFRLNLADYKNYGSVAKTIKSIRGISIKRKAQALDVAKKYFSRRL